MDKNTIYQNCISFQYSDDECIINGHIVPKCPGGYNLASIIDGHIYMNGYEFKNGEWKRTLKALYYMFAR